MNKHLSSKSSKNLIARKRIIKPENIIYNYDNFYIKLSLLTF